LVESVWGQGRPGGCAHYADDVEYVDYGVGQSFPGREAVEAFWQSFFDVVDVDAFTTDTTPSPPPTQPSPSNGRCTSSW